MVCSATEGVDRRTVLAVLAVTGAGIAASDAALALPRGGIDARVASAFNNAFAAGGDMVVRLCVALNETAGMRQPTLAACSVTQGPPARL